MAQKGAHSNQFFTEEEIENFINVIITQSNNISAIHKISEIHGINRE